jgi:transcriptional regulator with XRE-family HTH domain
MESLFTELKNAREVKGLSILDIASATNINPDLLTALEQGKTDILPETYIRAFLREYASVVGLDPQAMMHRYDELKNPPSPKAKTPEPEVALSSPVVFIPPSVPSAESHLLTKDRTVGVVALLVILTAVIYWNLNRPRPATTPEAIVPSLPSVDTTTIPAGPPGAGDSLTLRSWTTDTVWVRIIRDSQDTLEYVLRPKARRTWKARERLLVSLGNAGAIEFTLNDVPLGTMGKRGAVLRDSLITYETLETIRSKH